MTSMAIWNDPFRWLTHYVRHDCYDRPFDARGGSSASDASYDFAPPLIALMSVFARGDFAMPGCHSRPVRMLLVDDDPSMLKLVRLMVERSFPEQVSVDVAEDPRIARQMIDQSPVDIVITDMEMPGVNGLEIVRCAKRRNAYTQVLMLTGHSTVDSLLDAMELGATDYLLKPLNRDELVAVLTETMNRLTRWRKALSSTYATRSKPLIEPSAQTAP